MNAQRELDQMERDQRRADARFRGEAPEPDDNGEITAGELLLGGALVGLLLLTIIVAISALVAAVNAAKRRRR
jgi:hypothetical protein